MVPWSEVWTTQIRITTTGPAPIDDIWLPLLSVALLDSNHHKLAADQFTGLQDKDGKDIYEGDLLKTDGHYDVIYSEDKDPVESHNGWRLWQVIWFSGTRDINGEEYADIHTGFAVKQVGTSGNPEHMSSGPEGIAPTYEFTHYGGNGGCCTDGCQIIGNIHQNPELLTPASS